MQTFYASRNQMLPPLVKIMQSFILMQHTKKRDWIGGHEIFFQKVPFLANIGCCPSFLDYALCTLFISWFLLRRCKLISPFFKLDFSGHYYGKMATLAQNDKGNIHLLHPISLEPEIIYDLWYTSVKWWYLQDVFFIFWKF